MCPWQSSLRTGKFTAALAVAALVGCGGGTSPSAPIPPNANYEIYEGRETVVLDSKLLSCSYNGFFDTIHVEPCVEVVDDNAIYSTYGRMAGFDPKWGTTYQVTVDHWRLSADIADASAIYLVAQDVVMLAEDPVGTQYHYENVAINRTFGQDWLFAGSSQWSCQTLEGCDWIYSYSAPVDLTFEIGPDRQMILVDAGASEVDGNLGNLTGEL